MADFNFSFGRPSGGRRVEERPFVLGVLADLSGTPAEPLEPLPSRNFVEIDVDNFDARLAAARPRVAFAVPNVVTGEGEVAVDIAFKSLDDFGPGPVAAAVPLVSTLWNARSQLAVRRSRPEASQAQGTPQMAELLASVLDDPALVEAITGGGEAPAAPAEPSEAAAEPPEGGGDFAALLGKKVGSAPPRKASSFMQGLFDQALSDTARISDEAVETIGDLVDRLDARIGSQLDAILHHDAFKALEATWRGLDYLVSNTDTDETLKLCVLNCSKAELGAALEGGALLGGNPLVSQLSGRNYGCLVADYAFDHGGGDVAILAGLGQVASAVGVAVVAGAAASLLGLERWQDLPQTVDTLQAFSRDEYAAWRELAGSAAAQRLFLTMPRFLARLPYGRKTNPAEGIEYEETAPVDDPSAFVWCSAAYGMGVVVTRAVSIDGWAAELTAGGEECQVDGLPVYTFTNKDGDSEMMCPTERSMTVEFGVLLSKLGLAPLLHLRNTDRAVFVSVPSLGRRG